ncbi:MAG TPA: cell division protein ZipA C-terminal FtsZ-binding domain-containing protein [Steroidobacteraceae bacterium]
MAEFRWILLGLGLTLIGAIWWWGSRRSGQAPGNAALREPASSFKEPQMQEMAKAAELPPAPVQRERSPALEPLQVHTGNFDDIPMVDEPIIVDIDPVHVPDAEGPREPFRPHITQPVPVVTQPVPVTVAPRPQPRPVLNEAPAAVPAAIPTVMPETSDKISTLAPQVPNTSERQKIVSVRVCAAGTLQWPGQKLLSAFEAHGLAYGRYQVFHRRHVDGRSLFCVASSKEPGTFDVGQMAEQEFKGLTLFAVLPGPLEPLLTVDELLGAARELAAELAGHLQDSKGMPMSPQRAAALRDEVARFQASISVS